MAFKWKDQNGIWRDNEPIGHEEIFYRNKGLFLIAEAIDAVCTLWLSDGRVFKGSVRFPACKIDSPLFEPVAESVTTTGGELVEVKP